MFTTPSLSPQSLTLRSSTSAATTSINVPTTSAVSINAPSSHHEATLEIFRTTNARIQNLVQQHIVLQAIEDIKTPGGGGLGYVHQAEPWLLNCYGAFQGSNSTENLAQGPSTYFAGGSRRNDIIFTAEGWITIQEDKDGRPLVHVSNPNTDPEYFYRMALDISRQANPRQVSDADTQHLRQRLAQWLAQNANNNALQRGLADFFEKHTPSLPKASVQNRAISPNTPQNISPRPSPKEQVSAAFPPEVLRKIFSHLSPKDLAACETVCKDWSKSAKDDIFWFRFLKKDASAQLAANNRAQSALLSSSARTYFLKNPDARQSKFAAVDKKGLTYLMQLERRLLNEQLHIKKSDRLNSLPGSALRLIQNDLLKEETVRSWIRNLRNYADEPTQSLFLNDDSGSCPLDLIEAGQLPLSVFINWTQQTTRLIDNIALLALAREGLPKEQFEAWIHQPNIFARVNRNTRYIRGSEIESLLQTWHTHPERLLTLIQLPLPADVFIALLPYIDTLDLNLVNEYLNYPDWNMSSWQITEKWKNAVLNENTLQKKITNTPKDPNVSSTEQTLTTAEKAPGLNTTTQASSIGQRALTFTNLTVQAQLNRLISDKRLLAENVDEQLFGPFGSMIANAIRKGVVTQERLHELLNGVANSTSNIDKTEKGECASTHASPFSSTEEAICLIRDILPAAIEKKCDVETIVAWYRELKNYEGPQQPDLQRSLLILKIANTGVSQDTLTQWMRDPSISIYALIKAFQSYPKNCLDDLPSAYRPTPAHNALSTGLITPEQMEQWFHGAFNTIYRPNSILNHALAAVKDGSLSLKTLNQWYSDSQDTQPWILLDHIRDKIDASIKNPQKLHKALFNKIETLWKNISTERKARDHCFRREIATLTRIINQHKAKEALADKMAPASTHTALPRVAPQLPRHIPTPQNLPLKQALQETLSRIEQLRRLPCSKVLMPNLSKYQNDFDRLHTDLSLPHFDANIFQEKIENFVQKMEASYDIHTQLEQRMQKLALPLENNVRHAIHEIAENEMWAGPAGEIAPRLIPFMDGWPAHRILVIENEDGAEQARFYAEEHDPRSIYSMPLTAENSVRIRHYVPRNPDDINEEHYDAVRITSDGQFIVDPIPRDGNCLYNAILNGLSAEERETLLGDSPHHRSPSLQLRQRLAEFLIDNENIRNCIPSILAVAEVVIAEPEKKPSASTTSQLLTANESPHTQQKKRPAAENCAPFSEKKRQRKDDPDSDANGVQKNITTIPLVSMAATASTSTSHTKNSAPGHSTTQRVAPQPIIQNLITTPVNHVHDYGLLQHASLIDLLSQVDKIMPQQQYVPERLYERVPNKIPNTEKKSVQTNTDRSAFTQASSSTQKTGSVSIDALRQKLAQLKVEKEYLKQEKIKELYFQASNIMRATKLRQTAAIDSTSQRYE